MDAGYLLGPFPAGSDAAASSAFTPLLLSPSTLSRVRWDVVLDQGAFYARAQKYTYTYCISPTVRFQRSIASPFN
jgi:hypothetical protein